MRRPLKFLGYGVAVLALTLALLAAWATWFLDLDDHKDRLQTVIARATGLEVAFLGPIEHYILDGLHLEFRELAIRSGGETLAVVESLRLQLSLVALLERKIIFQRLRARVRQLDLVRDAAGALNLLPDLAGGSKSPGGLQIRQMSVQELTLEFVRGRYRDETERRDWAFEDVAVRLARLPVMVASEMVIDDPAVLLAQRCEGEVRAGSVDLGDWHLEDVGIAFESEQDALRFPHVTLGIRGGEPGRAGRIALQAEDYALQLARDDSTLSVAVAKGRLTLEDQASGASWTSLSVVLGGDGQLAFQGHSGDAPTSGLPLQTLRIDQSSLHVGEGTLRTSQGVYRLKAGRLEATGVPLVRNGRLFDWTRTEDLMALAETLRLTWYGTGLEHGRWDIPSLSLGLAGRGDRIAIEDLEARLGDTLLSGAGEVTLAGDIPSWQLSLTSEGVDLERLLALFPTDLRGEGSVQGTLLLAGTGLALERAEFASVVADVKRLRSDSDWGPLRLGKTRLKAKALPLLVDGIGLEELLRTHPQGLVDLEPWRLSGQGDTVALGGVRLVQYQLTLANGKGRLNLELEKGRLSVDVPASQGPVKALSLTLRGKARLHAQGDATKGDARTLPWHTLSAEQLQFQAGQVVVTTREGEYKIAEAFVKAGQLPLIVEGRALDWTRPQDRILVIRNAGMHILASELRHQDWSVDSVSLELSGRDDRLLVEAFQVRLAGTALTGDGELTLGKATPPWRIHLAGKRVAAGPVLAIFGAPFQADGRFDVELNLQGIGLNQDQLLQRTLRGQARLSGRDIQVQGMDLDKVLTHLQYTSDGGLLDVGAYLLAGPAGALLVTGSDYTNLLRSAEAKGSSRVLHSHTELNIEDGVVRARDVAMATPRHRVALKGEVDLKQNRALDVEIATVSPEGCAIYVEKVAGTLDAPRIDQSGLLVKGVLRPIRSVVGTLRRILPTSCPEPFYAGVVQPPHSGDKSSLPTIRGIDGLN